MKKRIFVAMDHEGDTFADMDVDVLHEHIAEHSVLLPGYRLVAVDIEMTPPAKVDDDGDATVTVAVPDNATAVTAEIAA